MSKNETVAALKHADTEFAVRQRIELAPATMQIRELLQNAIESASLAGRSGIVKFYAINVPVGRDKCRKLAIYNTGPGMNADKLAQFTNLAYSGEEKKQGVLEHFGVGAKTSGLKANPEGMRYWSCCDGVVSEVTLALRDGVYGRLRKQIGGEWLEVCDVTKAAIKNGYDCSRDWTEVVLLGQTPDHDTVRNAFDVIPPQQAYWLRFAINNRFYDLSSVRVLVEATASPAKDHGRQLVGLKGFKTKRDETVDCGGGVHVRYGIGNFSKGGSGAPGKYGYTAHGCLVWNNECYDFHPPSVWNRSSPRYGIVHGASQIFVQVILDETFGAVPDQYRQRLQSEDRSVEYRLQRFQELIYENRPEWLCEYMAKLAPGDDGMSKSLERRLRELLREANWRKQMYQLDEEGEDLIKPTERSDDERPPADDPDRHPSTAGETPGNADADDLKPARPQDSRRGRLPKTEWFHGGTDKSSGPCSGRAAMYVADTHVMLFNSDYEVIEKAANAVQQAFVHVTDQAELLETATREVKEQIVFVVHEQFLYTKAHDGTYSWSRSDVDKPLAPECLTVPASNPPKIANAVRIRLANRYGKSRKVQYG